MRILVVDDSKAMRNVVMRAVKAAGHADPARAAGRHEPTEVTA